MTDKSIDPKISMWLPDPVSNEVSASLKRLADSDDVHRIAVMPDVHLGTNVCNGTVIATKDLVYPVAVGADIGCGMLAVRIDLESSALSTELAAGRLLAGLYSRIPSIKHARPNCPSSLPAKLDKELLSNSSLEKQKQRDGLFQLGTLGRGNHFVEFQADDDGQLWLMLHSGSRGMGQAITDFHMQTTRPSRTGLVFLDASTLAGQDYLSDLNWAIEYAMENRMAIARAIETIFLNLFEATFDWLNLIHCHHNHVRREVHFGEQYWIHRKGALPASEHEPGLIPGSMGTNSYHVTGRGLTSALRSSSHGAGRSMARNVARSRISQRDLLNQMRGIWFDQRYANGLRDEAPTAYKDIHRVMRAQRDLTRILRQLRPLLIYKGT